ncbi:sensor histidine kinase [Lysinibacillus sp. PLM2]|nr:sensor histidine kinase [Lysinibacillus sp. PLM2]
MSIKNKVSLKRYWTSWYLITLCIGLVIIGIISALWIRHTTLENRLNLMTFAAESMADRVVDGDERPFHGKEMPNMFAGREERINPFNYIVDIDGKVIFSDRPFGPINDSISMSIIESESSIQKILIDETNYYFVKEPIVINESTIGWVLVVDSEKMLTEVNREYTQLFLFIISLGLLGWLVIYILSNRLSKPIQTVANAAKQVAEGNYQIKLPPERKEKEVDDLIQSFKEMTFKLEHLESLRTELLAGVTHELKTPVTSISGLLQAINDDVVTGDDAKEFIAISLKETEKMKKMVEDLLAFNQFAANVLDVNPEVQLIDDVVEDAISSWELSQKEKNVDLEVMLLEKDTKVYIDSIRFQQIMTNLLNNAQQALDDFGEIQVRTTENETYVFVDVIDSGKGIPEEEEPYIFERFFRGSDKKYKVRGLGLGLSLSKMIAQALEGDLQLIKSSSEGTTFRVILKKVVE